jgi:hypothetical protein
VVRFVARYALRGRFTYPLSVFVGAAASAWMLIGFGGGGGGPGGGVGGSLHDEWWPFFGCAQPRGAALADDDQERVDGIGYGGRLWGFVWVQFSDATFQKPLWICLYVPLFCSNIYALIVCVRFGLQLNRGLPLSFEVGRRARPDSTKRSAHLITTPANGFVVVACHPNQSLNIAGRKARSYRPLCARVLVNIDDDDVGGRRVAGSIASLRTTQETRSRALPRLARYNILIPLSRGTAQRAPAHRAVFGRLPGRS